ncbi:hypothetical protein O181_016697 [Austropuccinia psidii MF-1]|uniref:Uncharacterized protein n=1 Tax=Austropuccinia psidii MF-1 TaxID=1389203 RepID=A0A9Q3GRX6_9BASI|nr:hypothetical protein [Austropuccinia psidii MF-1]
MDAYQTFLEDFEDVDEDKPYEVTPDTNHSSGHESTPPPPRRNPPKRQPVRSAVHDYLEKLTPIGECIEDKQCFHFIYKCRHFSSNKIGIMDKNTSNLKKHCDKFCGRVSAWEAKIYGAIDPCLGARLAAEEQELLQKELVEALVSLKF